MYKHLEKISVKSNIPNSQSISYTARRFRSSKDICKYNCTDEEAFLASNPESLKLHGHNSDLRKSLNELDESNQPSVLSGKKEISAAERETQMRMKAETIAEAHLGTEDATQFLAFIDFYVQITRNNDPSEFPDELVLKAFPIFKGDAEKSVEFIRIAVELQELGFDGENVVSALLLNSNDREAALDFLMKT